MWNLARLAIAFAVAIFAVNLIGNWAHQDPNWELGPLVIDWTEGSGRPWAVIAIFVLLVLLLRKLIFRSKKD